MNRNQVKGAIKDAAGKVQREVGEALGDHSQAASGAAKQVEGKAQKSLGNAQAQVEGDVVGGGRTTTTTTTTRRTRGTI